MSFYKSPPPNYDFRQNSDYITIVDNSLKEDVDLLKLIESTHYLITHILRHVDDTIPVIKNGSVVSTKVILQKKKFDNIDSVIEYIVEISKINYFFMYSYADLTLTFSILSLTENINGLKDYKRDRLLSTIGI